MKPAPAALVHRLTTGAYRLALQMLGKPEDAQDVVQESFMRLWRSQPSDAHGAQLSTYFNTIVINRCKSHLVRRARAHLGR
jgi:RNA polymerase sigma-70 factor (ECF subfamily)